MPGTLKGTYKKSDVGEYSSWSIKCVFRIFWFDNFIIKCTVFLEKIWSDILKSPANTDG